MSNSSGDGTRLLVVDDDTGMHTLVHDLFTNESTSIFVATTLSDGLRIASKLRIDVVLLDHMLPDGEGIDRIPDFISQDRLRPILYITAQAGSKTAIEAIKRGAFEYLSKPIDFQLLRQRLAEAIEYRRLTRIPVLVESDSTRAIESDVLVGRCRSMQEVYKCIGRFSNLRSPILIEGEVGTGKEMIARSLHQNGSMAKGPFRKISSREFSDAELQTELFGGNLSNVPSASVEVGKSALHKPSALLKCSGGTLMIDDIECWSVATQSRLLRFLQSNSIDGVTVDTKVILATSQRVRDLAQTGGIRNDLFYVLSPFVIRVPALRERQEDLELLVSHFMQRIANVSTPQQGQGPPRVSSGAMQLLKDYAWPGNIAQLKSVLQGVLTESRGAILATDTLMRFLEVGLSRERISQSELANPKTNALAGQPTKPMSEPSSFLDLKSFVVEQIANSTEHLYEQAIALLDERLIHLVLKHTNGNKVKAAKILGITRTSLRRKMNAGLPAEGALHASDPSQANDLRRDDEHE